MWKWFFFFQNNSLYSRGARNALFSLTDAEWHMSIKNGRSPALLFFLILLAMLRCVARRYQGGGLTLLESCRGCCWSRYDAEPEIGEENSASLMTSRDASRMYDLDNSMGTISDETLQFVRWKIVHSHLITLVTCFLCKSKTYFWNLIIQ